MGGKKFATHYRWNWDKQGKKLKACFGGHRAYTGVSSPTRDKYSHKPDLTTTGNPPLTGSKRLASGRVAGPLEGLDKACRWTGPGPLRIHGTEQYRIDRIRDSTLVDDVVDGVSVTHLYYRVDWSGWPAREGCQDLAWYPASNLANCPAKIQEFHNTWPNKPGPPERLDDWQAYFVRGRPPPPFGDNDRPGRSKSGPEA